MFLALKYMPVLVTQIKMQDERKIYIVKEGTMDVSFYFGPKT